MFENIIFLATIFHKKCWDNSSARVRGKGLLGRQDNVGTIPQLASVARDYWAGKIMLGQFLSSRP